MHLLAYFLPINKLKNDFNILPPSNGYIGIKLNNTSSKFENIILYFKLKSIFIKIHKIITIILKIGPATATNIFFTSNKLDFNIFLL